MELKIVPANKAREVSLENQKKNIDGIIYGVTNEINAQIKCGATRCDYLIGFTPFNNAMMNDFITELEQLGYKVELLNKFGSKTLRVIW